LARYGPVATCGATITVLHGKFRPRARWYSRNGLEAAVLEESPMTPRWSLAFGLCELRLNGVLRSSLPEAAIWRTEEICHLPKCLERLSKNSLGGVSGIDVVGPPQRMDRTPMSPTQPTQGRLTRLEWLKSSSEPPEQCWQPLKRRYNRRRFLYIPILLHLLLLGPRFLFESWKEKTCISHLEFVLLSSKRSLHLQDLLLPSDH
jgi:hypothetical protein